MKHRLLLFVGCLCLVTVFAVGTLQPARGKDIITDAQIKTIKMHCTDILASLNSLQQNDTLLRHDRGELYRTLSDKLMVPLNQRIASNQLDGADLVKTTANYNDAYQMFYNAYKNYDTALTSALQIDCTKQPTTFYDRVADTRQKRIALHTASQRMVRLATQYKTQFDIFKKTNKKAVPNE